MSKQVVTIGYLKTFVDGILTVSTDKSDSYCPTYSELTGGDLVTNYKADTNPTKTTNGIKITGCTVTTTSTAYTDNQLVIERDLQLLYQQLQSIDVTAATSPVSCCGGSSTLSTTAYFKLLTKSTGGTATADTATSAVVTGTYSEDKTYTSIDGSAVKFDKNTIDYPTSTKANERETTVTASYKYSGVTKEDTVVVKQSANEVGEWVWKSDTTTSIDISPNSINFGSCANSIEYSVTRYYDSYYEKYDTCGAKMDSKTDHNNIGVTPSDASVTGDFTCTTTKVSAETNTGSYRTGKLTVSYDSKSDSVDVTQAASQAGTYYGAAYGSYTDLDVLGDEDLSCDGGTASYTASYYRIYYKDYEVKDHCGNVTSTGTTSYPSTTDVTNSSTWETNVGSITNSGVLTYGSTTSDRTIDITATYSNYSTTTHAYQKDCKEPEPEIPTTKCMHIHYTTFGDVNATVYFKTTDGVQQAQDTVTTSVQKSLCDIAEDTEIVVTCSDSNITLEGDTTFTFKNGNTAFITLRSSVPEKPLVSTIYVLNNCPGTVNIEYSKPTGGKEYTSITADNSGIFNLPLSGQTDVQVSIPRDNYESSSSNFIYVEFRDSAGNTLPVNPSGNAMEEGGGAKAMPNLMGGSSESSICTTTSKYQACATILFEAKN